MSFDRGNSVRIRRPAFVKGRGKGQPSGDCDGPARDPLQMIAEREDQADAETGDHTSVTSRCVAESEKSEHYNSDLVSACRDAKAANSRVGRLFVLPRLSTHLFLLRRRTTVRASEFPRTPQWHARTSRIRLNVTRYPPHAPKCPDEVLIRNSAEPALLQTCLQSGDTSLAQLGLSRFWHGPCYSAPRLCGVFPL
jgi:hypothetical protein